MTSEPHLSRLARGGALNLAGAASAGLMGFALVFAVAHAYPQKVAGAFFAATSLFVILNAVAGLGSDAGLLRWLPRHLALGDHGAARRTVPVALVPVAAWRGRGPRAGPRGARAGGHHRRRPGRAMLRVLAVFLPVAAAHDAMLAATRGHSTMRPTVAIEKIFRQVAQVAGVLAGPSSPPTRSRWRSRGRLPYAVGLVVAAAWYLRIAAPARRRYPAEHPVRSPASSGATPRHARSRRSARPRCSAPTSCSSPRWPRRARPRSTPRRPGSW